MEWRRRWWQQGRRKQSVRPASSRYGRCHPQGAGAPQEPHPGRHGLDQGRDPDRPGRGRDLAAHRLLPRAAQPAGRPAHLRQAVRAAGRAGPALQHAGADRERRGRERAGSAAHRDRVAQRRHHRLRPRRAPDVDREPDADRRREHRRHRVRRAMAGEGRVQVRLRRAQRRGHCPLGGRSRHARGDRPDQPAICPDRGPHQGRAGHQGPAAEDPR